MTNTTSPIDLLVSAIDSVGSPACVGVDPVFDKLPTQLKSIPELEAIEQFSIQMLDALVGNAQVVKPQSACFERYGSKGYAILEKVVTRARELGFVVILDAKRGDIGSSATHYAVGAADMGANFITVSPYMGPSSIEPFLDAGLGVFSLARTSNPDSDVVQLQELKLGSPVAHGICSMIAQMGQTRLGNSGLSNLGAVVGATKSADDVRALRNLMPNQMLLVPGVGAQGGTVADVGPMTRTGASSAGQLGVIVNASRSVIYAAPNADENWLDAINRASSDFANDLKSLIAISQA
ncbi:MAG: orotidine-5'-phosphate decarboxylase [Phycisphaerales bacterium]|nr:orotidine-5'-phosphate decarboxylase [Phycisphaerales bacterium]